MTLLLRHVNSYESGPGSEHAVLGADGMMTVERLLSFKMCRILQANVADVESVLAHEDPGKICFIATRDAGGQLLSLGAAQ